LSEFGYMGPISLELAHGTSMAEISKCKALFEGLLKRFET
jgi:hypothetical protein